MFTLLYASEGAPIGFIWWALPSLLRERGGAVDSITSVLALVTAMWAFKFLWAPLVDRARTRGISLPTWIAMAQFGMIATLIPVAWVDPVHDLTTLGLLLVAHALAATTQDIAIDALVIETTPRGELGRINGWMSAGKYIGRGLFGGVALIVANSWGFTGIIWSMTFMLCVPLPFVLSLPRDLGLRTRDGPGRHSWHAVFHGRHVVLGLAFALTAGTGFEAIGALSGTYLIDRGLDSETVGWLRTFLIVGAMILGGLVGGSLTDALGTHRCTRTSLLALVATHLALALVEGLGASSGSLVALLVTTYFLYGVFIASSYALFMELTEPALAATQFSLFMAATNGCESWASWAAGQLVERAGYAPAFFALGLVSLTAVPLVPHLRREE